MGTVSRTTRTSRGCRGQAARFEVLRRPAGHAAGPLGALGGMDAEQDPAPGQRPCSGPTAAPPRQFPELAGLPWPPRLEVGVAQAEQDGIPGGTSSARCAARSGTSRLMKGGTRRRRPSRRSGAGRRRRTRSRRAGRRAAAWPGCRSPPGAALLRVAARSATIRSRTASSSRRGGRAAARRRRRAGRRPDRAAGRAGRRARRARPSPRRAATSSSCSCA